MTLRNSPKADETVVRCAYGAHLSGVVRSLPVATTARARPLNYAPGTGRPFRRRTRAPARPGRDPRRRLRSILWWQLQPRSASLAGQRQAPVPPHRTWATSSKKLAPALRAASTTSLLARSSPRPRTLKVCQVPIPTAGTRRPVPTCDRDIPHPQPPANSL